MSKQFGLILPKDKGAIKRPAIFDESDSDEPADKPSGLKRPLKKQEKITRTKALEEDPTVFQYDEIYDEMDKKRKESKLGRKDLDRKPKYISRLLAAAERRKKDNERRIEREVQKEREAEGEEFKDKESFVTTAYRKKLEEMKEQEEIEKREEYLEAIGDVKKQGNLDGFYRHLYDQKVNYETKVKEEPKELDEEPKELDEEPKELDEEPEKSTKRTYRKRKSSESDEEEIKKEHLPSNLDADSDFSIDSSDSEEEKVEKMPPPPPPPVEVEIKQEEKQENKIEEIEVKEKKPKIDIWKKRTVGEVFDAAVQRYFERKSLREL